jgi:membrane protease subunit HflK
MNYELYKLKESFKKIKSSLFLISTIVILIVFSFTSYYTVEPDEEAVVIRLGRYLKTTPPGLHFKIPFGIDSVTKVKTRIVHQAEFGFRTTQTSFNKRSSYSSNAFDNESLMLTGDLNVADVEWVVQFQITDPFKFLFKTSDPIANIRDVSESIMRRVVGDKLVTDVLTTGRVEIATKAKILMQEILNKYDLGITIKSIKLQDVNPPHIVQASFNDVNAAKQEQEKMINQAEENYNKIIPEAKGKANKMISEAEAYSEELINKAYGDANQFQSLYTEYRKAPKITKKRIFLETMESIYANMENITIVDPKVKGLLPIFNKGLKNE